MCATNSTAMYTADQMDLTIGFYFKSDTQDNGFI